MVTRVVRNSLQRPRPLLRGRFSGTLSGELIRRCHAARVPLREFLSRRIVLLAVGSVSLCRATVEKRIQRLLRKSLPEPVENITFSHRIAGEGSLGRPRYVATG